jgi:hypothetical protein
MCDVAVSTSGKAHWLAEAKKTKRDRRKRPRTNDDEDDEDDEDDGDNGDDDGERRTGASARQPTGQPATGAWQVCSVADSNEGDEEDGNDVSDARRGRPVKSPCVDVCVCVCGCVSVRVDVWSEWGWANLCA